MKTFSVIYDLVVCQRILALMGANLCVESEGTGHGSRFYFTLPLSLSMLSIADAALVPASVTLETCVTSSHPSSGPQEIVSIVAEQDDRLLPDQILSVSEEEVTAIPSLILIDSNFPRRQALIETISSLRVRVFSLTSVDRLREVGYDHEAADSPLVIAYLDDFPPELQSNPSKIVQMFRATHLPRSMNRRVLLIANMKAPALSPGEDFLILAKPMSHDKLMKGINRLMPGFLPVPHTSDVEVFEAYAESDLTFDDVDLESICSYQIVIVDDSSMDQRLLQMQFEQKGFKHITTAASGTEVIKMLEQSDCHYDLVVVNVDLSDMSGFEAARQIKSLPSYEQVSVIGVTQHHPNSQSWENPCIEMVLSKPVDLHDVICSIKKHRDNNLRPPTRSIVLRNASSLSCSTVRSEKSPRPENQASPGLDF